MDQLTLSRINQLIRREVVPATGCTEPACVALAVAYAVALLPQKVRDIEVWLSANMLKNAMGVGIPGTGQIGIPIAIALGAVLKAPERQLELLDHFTQEELNQANQMVEQGLMHTHLKDTPNLDKLYVEVIARDNAGHKARSVIERTHISLKELQLDGEDRLPKQEEGTFVGCSETIQQVTSINEEDIPLTFSLVYEYATQAPLEDIDFIYEAAQQNKRVGEYALKGNFGHGVGKLIQGDMGQKFFGSSPLAHMLSYTSGACDARMDGAPVTVMSNSGSGNQGITATLPVLTFAESQGCDRERTTRALMMSGLLVVYIKQLLGRLSCLCGMVVSGIGSSAAIVYLMGGTKEQSSYAIKNMIGNVTGMICDGAKPSCSLKASTGICSGLIAAMMAMQNNYVKVVEGIVEDDIDDCIRTLAEIGRDGMLETDRKVLEVMTNKKK